MTEHDNAPTADEAEQPLREAELDGIAGGTETYVLCLYCKRSFSQTGISEHYTQNPTHTDY